MREESDVVGRSLLLKMGLISKRGKKTIYLIRPPKITAPSQLALYKTNLTK